jgi:multisubunit Na+/H+ antiporter MnhB subunit
MPEDLPKRNYLRRCTGIVICALPLLLSIACTLWPRTVSLPRSYAGLVLVGIACLVAAFNFNLSFLRPRRYQRTHGTMEGYRFVSGLPVFGTFLLVAGCILAFGSVAVGICGLAAGLLDPDGIPWFVIRTWKDSSFWDVER